MNWGYKIMVVIILFLIGMGTMLSIAMKQKNEMVDSDYYVKELQHQQLIDAANNLSATGETIQLKDSGYFIVLSIPIVTNTDINEGNVEFLRSSDQSKDRNFPLSTNTEGKQFIDRKMFFRGQYRVRAQWKSKGVKYYTEQNFFVQ